MPKRTRDFKLPRLTISEAARLLNVEDRDAFELWAYKKLLPMSATELRRWRNESETTDRDKARPLPEDLIRLYLMEHPHVVHYESLHAELPEARAPEQRGDRQPEGPAIPKRRARG